MPLLLAILLTGAPLTVSDAAVGDFVDYQFGGVTLELRACAKDPHAVTVAVSVRRPDGQALGLLERGVLIAVPTRPLTPAVEIPESVEVGARSLHDHHFGDCVSYAPLRLTDMTATTVRCTARELILGAGLYSSEQRWMLPSPHRIATQLVDVGNRSEPCPAWPRVSVGGWMRASGETTTFEPGSAWVRIQVRSRGASSVRTVSFAEWLVELARAGAVQDPGHADAPLAARLASPPPAAFGLEPPKK